MTSEDRPAIRIAMWSGPRNLSTAMMRSFSSRADTFVSDEPFYGAYLRATGDPQPMAAEIVQGMDCDWASITQALNGPVPDGSLVWYQKHMPHHMEGPISILDFPGMRHAFLIRDPVRVAASYANKRATINADHLGIARQRRYFDRIAEKTGVAPPVVDSADILCNPESVLRNLCEAIDIPWDNCMLGWPSGPHDQDGIWGAHWYDKVNTSTGFDSAPGPLPVLTDEYQHIAEACQEDYGYLRTYAITA
ncbi:HAD family hydrolase [Altererythrobacter sp.]|nr:HAD family hydrolase [Altererythrobacter sp.]